MPRPGTIEAVLLDWDGTLLDSFEADAGAYLEMFQAMGIGWGVGELAEHYSPDWYRVYRAAGLRRARWEEADRRWRKAYLKQKPKLMAGAREVLRVLRGRYRLGLVTSGSRGRVEPQVRRFRLQTAFSAFICHEDTRYRKPHPEPLRAALRQMRVAAGTAVYVGDAPEDIEMARRAGARAIGVLGPFPTERRLRAARPDALLESLAELPGLLRRWQLP
jgi:HAD superfamily hydrolase (TIGR01549 family)